MNWTKEGSLKAEIFNKFTILLSFGKKVFPISGQELYIFPASIPETNAPIIICMKKLRSKE